MAEIIRSHDCRSVLDIGCGDGRLLEHLLRQVGKCLSTLRLTVQALYCTAILFTRV